MHRRKSWNTSGVSEIIGTILILAMTVVLFSTIIIWVSTLPTPQASIRLDMDGTLTPIYDSAGNWKGANVTVQHRGGEGLEAFRTSIFYQVDRSGTFLTAHYRTRGTIGGVPFGIDGPNADWDAGETWSLTNYSLLQTDRVTLTVVDDVRSLILWNEVLFPDSGTFPPLFVEKWADRLPQTPTIDTPQTNRQFTIFAKVIDPDGDINRNSVYVYLAFLYGTPEHRSPQRMFDDGVSGGDAVAKDGIFTASYTFFKPTSLSWDGGVIIFNATDTKGHKSTSRMTLSVIEGPAGIRPNPNPGSGRPPNLNYNGLQGFNIFNGSEWDSQGFNATDTRVFYGNEEVVVIVGSAILKDTFGRNHFNMWDPFASQPSRVVYGPNKQVGPSTTPSSTQAFEFFLFVNGYNVWIYRFQLNNATISSQCTADGGICFKKTPAHPPEYFFATYSVEFDLIDFLGNHFTATDAITVKDTDGTFRNYPKMRFYSDSGYTKETSEFNSTDNIWVAVSMLDVDANTDAVSFGTVQLRDFIGGTQVLKSFVNERDSNPPICPVTGTCTGRALSRDATTKTYRFRLNLTLADQDPWVEGAQHYSLSIAYVHDTTSNEMYADVSSQLLIHAPLFRLDVAGGNGDTTNPAWGTHDYGYYYENLNGADKWRKSRFEFCGLPGTGSCKNENTYAVAFIDGDLDGDLDIADGIQLDNNNAEVNYYRRSVDFDGNVVFSKFTLSTLVGNAVFAKDMEVGDLTGDLFPEILVGLTNGELWMYKNDGTWTSGVVSSPVKIDTTRTAAINGITVGDFDADLDLDIAVARAGGTVTYYANLDGRGTFSTGGITDRWYVDQESLQVGTMPTPDYLKTVASDDVREEIREANHTENVQTGSTTNPSVDSAAAPWTYSDWENGAQASGAWQNTGGNPNGLIYVQDNFLASQTVSGYWYQSFTVSGSPPYTATVKFDYKVSAYGAGTGNVKIYVFVDKTAGAPTVGTEVISYTETSTTAWLSKTGITVPSNRIPSPGTYYIKFAVRTTNGASGSTTTVQFDNGQLSWQSTGGNAGELLHYWRIQQLPNRPSTSFSLRVEGHRTVSTDGDTFIVSFSRDVVGNDPTTGTYKNVIWLNATSSDTAYTYSFNASENSNLPGDIVWLRIVDTDHTVGNVTFDTARLDHIYIEAVTQSIPPGASIVLPSTPGDATSIDADDQNADGYWDVVVGTANSHVYKLIGYSGGLQAPAAIFYTAPGGTITGIKLANITTTSAGLEIVFAYTNHVRVIAGTGSPPPQIGADVTTTVGINTLGAGDVDGDGDDDVIVGTAEASNALVYFRNFGNGASWGRYNIEPIPTGTTIIIWDIYLGDGNKSQFLGR
ncbi:MAG TPA: FG-GAP-like repeat-containing protein [Thermoplasmata archaeon]|nr:FG-GAP-like repeat-containing protein [Thermoplasmata archaeon]